MPITPGERREMLAQWAKPSSNAEQARQDRACRMVRDAIDAHPAFKGLDINVYPKGSYPNNTNVRLDSDVDIVVECHECFYYDYFGDFPHPSMSGAGYTGPWSPSLWRSEVTAAIVNCFGGKEVDRSSSIALKISEKPGSRPSADVVPSFLYYRYDTPDRRVRHRGCKVFKTTGDSIVNWPEQQLDNGRKKNVATGQRYKDFVRVLKNAENRLVFEGRLPAKPSYLMECLVWSVPDGSLTAGDVDTAFRSTLVWLWTHLTDQYRYTDWDEPNRLKYLFASGQKWTCDDAKAIVGATWRLLGY